MGGKSKKIFFALTTLSGTIIGAGLFALPYIAVQVGIWVMLGYLLGMTILVVILHQLFAEVALNTKDFLRLPSYARIHLGEWSRGIALITTVIGFIGSILAYIIIGGGFLSDFLLPVFGGSVFLYTFIYFAMGALLIFFGIKSICKVEFLDIVLFIIILAGLYWGSSSFMTRENLNFAASTKDFFLPYGAILFSLWGISIIPEIEEMLEHRKHLLKKIIPLAVIIPAVFYLLFIFAVVAISGARTTPEAIIGLKGLLGSGIYPLLLIFGLIATFTSYLSLGLTLTNVFHYDLKISRNYAWLIACFAPFLLFLAGLKDFIKVIGFVGAATLAIEGILIVLMYNKIKRKWLLTFPLIVVLLAGIVYAIVYFLK